MIKKLVKYFLFFFVFIGTYMLYVYCINNPISQVDKVVFGNFKLMIIQGIITVILLSVGMFYVSKSNGIELNIFKPYKILLMLFLMLFHSSGIVALWVPFFKPFKLIRFDFFIWILIILYIVFLRIKSFKPEYYKGIKFIYYRLLRSNNLNYLIFTIFFIISIGINIQFERMWHVTGDEPHHLVATQSMIEDKDINLSNNFINKTYRSFLDEDIKDPHVFIVDGKFLPLHFLGLSTLAIPFFAFKGVFGVRLLIGIIFGLAMVSLNRLLRYILKNRNLSLLLTFICGSSIPFIIYSVQIFPDVFGLLLSLVSLNIYFKYIKNKKKPIKTIDLLLFSFCAAIMPWFQIRMVLLTLPLYLIFYQLFFERKNFKNIVYYNLPFVISGAIFILLNLHFYNTITGSTASESSKFVTNIAKGMVGFFFDRQYGILVYSPIYIFVFSGILLVVKKRVTQFLPMLFLYLPTAILIARYSVWHSGWSPVGRYMLVWMPLLVSLAGYGILNSKGKLTYIIIGIFAAYQLFVTYHMSVFPVLNYHEWELNVKNNNLFLLYFSNFKNNLNDLLPSIRFFDNTSKFRLIIMMFTISCLLIMCFIKKEKKKHSPVIDKSDIRKARLVVVVDVFIILFLLTNLLIYTNFASKNNIKTVDVLNDVNEKYLGIYYADENFKGNPYLIRYDEKIDFNWPGIYGRPLGDAKWYSVKWKKTINLKSPKIAVIEIVTDSHVVLKVNNIENEIKHKDSKKSTFKIKLNEGTNKVEIGFNSIKLDSLITVRGI